VRERQRHRGAHTSARAEGETAPRVDGAGEPAGRGERNPAAGGLGGDSPPVTRFLGHEEGLANLGVGLIWLAGVGRGLSAGRWRSSAAGIAVGELRARDWGGGVVF
jgi:hypothetical protein